MTSSSKNVSDKKSLSEQHYNISRCTLMLMLAEIYFDKIIHVEVFFLGYVTKKSLNDLVPRENRATVTRL